MDVSWKFEDPIQRSKLQSQMWSYHLDDKFCDVILESSDGVEVPCHKMVLSAGCQFFQAMFSSGMKEAQSHRIKLDLPSSTVKCLVEFIYTSSVDITEENAQGLLQVADEYQLTGLKKACTDFMIGRLQPCNCLGLHKFARLYNLTKLQDLAHKCMLENFIEVTQCEEFLKLEEEDLVHYIEDDTLNVNNEDIVFEAVLTWTKHVLSDRVSVLPDLLEHVRFPFCSPSYFLDNIETCDVMVNWRCKKFIAEYKHYHFAPERRGEITSKRIRPRKSSSLKNAVIVLGGCTHNSETNNHAFLWNLDTDQWSKCDYLSPPQVECGGIESFSLCSWQGNLVLSIQKGQGMVPSTCWLFDIIARQWKDITYNESLIGASTLSFQGKLLILGGKDTVYNSVSSKMLQLDVGNQKWMEVGSMLEPVHHHIATEFHGMLFVLGGKKKHPTLFDSSPVSVATQCYKPNQRKWQLCAPMPISLSSASTLIHEDKIFVFGTYIEHNAGWHCGLCSYSPQVDSWAMLAAPSRSHHFAPATTYNGKLIVLGGTDDVYNLTDSVEMYDPIKDVWELLNVKTHIALSDHAASFACLPSSW
ncbi:hypothetical protein NP493_164g03066 [Ridgeia piscesae]|uniref:BTB domain-containing protein n=1 Tax=Ridgeia piscesae TaxID=27915 RepID=A0AAD9P3I9_RIDPI|nr:hypothetical protein NP493_164g03066 [Ridgeia piscesae]